MLGRPGDPAESIAGHPHPTRVAHRVEAVGEVDRRPDDRELQRRGRITEHGGVTGGEAGVGGREADRLGTAPPALPGVVQEPASAVRGQHPALPRHPHRGELGLACETCHRPSVWSDLEPQARFLPALREYMDWAKVEMAQ